MTNDEFLDFSNNPLPIRVTNQSGKLEFRPDIENIRNDVEDALNEQEERLKESIRKKLNLPVIGIYFFMSVKKINSIFKSDTKMV